MRGVILTGGEASDESEAGDENLLVHGGEVGEVS